ncbi:hypothetical protein, partial [Propionivibrio sp.]|uniref:hypothetical protein n=1 Tax=Propionivibrio sp. TaxID=2212460 RepID=UPI003BF0182D
GTARRAPTNSGLRGAWIGNLQHACLKSGVFIDSSGVIVVERLSTRLSAMIPYSACCRSESMAVSCFCFGDHLDCAINAGEKIKSGSYFVAVPKNEQRADQLRVRTAGF